MQIKNTLVSEYLQVDHKNNWRSLIRCLEGECIEGVCRFSVNVKFLVGTCIV